MKKTHFSYAFSMLELIFVIIILGIVASIGSEMIAKVYEGYIVQRAQHSATLKTELAAAQIANRLASAIPKTVYRITHGNAFESFESTFSGSNDGDSYKGLSWVGSDAESFSAAAASGWSGFCDVNTSTQTILTTPGSNLARTNTIISNLSSTAKNISNAAIYFPDDTIEHNVSAGTGTSLTLDANAPIIYEHYKLAWSSYALVVESGDLYLYYNFAPSPATALGTTKSLLMKNVATFKFQGGGGTVRFKICKHERITDDVNITVCKEKVVF